MKTSELYKLIKNGTFKKAGSDIDYSIAVGLDNDKTIYLLFKGSTTIIDWKHNFAYTARWYKVYSNPKMKCHHGFADAYRSANDIIMAELLEEVNKHPDYKVVIAGWSFGGAMTLFAAEDFNYRTRSDKSDVNSGKKATIYTYGGPKVAADETTAAYIASCVTPFSKQYAHTQDMVTYAPPFWYFRHALPLTKVGPKLNPINVFGLLNILKYHMQYEKWIPQYNADAVVL